ncbi:hypothetical protein RYX36_028142 [Vicia faba]
MSSSSCVYSRFVRFVVVFFDLFSIFSVLYVDLIIARGFYAEVGKVYVQFKEEEHARKTIKNFTERFYSEYELMVENVIQFPWAHVIELLVETDNFELDL